MERHFLCIVQHHAVDATLLCVQTDGFQFVFRRYDGQLDETLPKIVGKLVSSNGLCV